MHNKEHLIKNLRVLIVEDEKVLRDNLHLFLSRRVSEVYAASNGREGLEMYAAKRPHVIVSDITMPMMSGLEMAESIRQDDQETAIMLLTAHSDQYNFIRAIEAGIDRYILKPVDIAKLIEALVMVAEKLHAKQEIETMRRRLEDSKRAESLLQLTKGLAHNFNNILVGIIGYVGLIQMKLQLSETLCRGDIQNEVNVIESSAERAASLIKKLIFLSNQIDCHKEPVLLNSIVISALNDLRPLLSKTITLKDSLTEESPLILANIGYLSELLNNIFTNAIESMPEGGTIETSTFIDGKEAVVAITDSGCGMDKETIGKIFEPFFTTKGLVSHLGLGLSTATSIAKEHGGRIEVKSELNKGSTFRVCLPLFREVS